MGWRHRESQCVCWNSRGNCIPEKPDTIREFQITERQALVYWRMLQFNPEVTRHWICHPLFRSILWQENCPQLVKGMALSYVFSMHVTWILRLSVWITSKDRCQRRMLRYSTVWYMDLPVKSLIFRRYSPECSISNLTNSTSFTGLG